MKEIESLLDTYKTAVFQKDVESFVSIFDDDVRIFDMWEWVYNGVTPWREMVKSWFGSLGTERVVVTFDEVQIQAGEGMAVVSAFARFAAISEKGEELRYLQNRLTWVVRRKGSNDGPSDNEPVARSGAGQSWKVIHEHTSGPVDGATMKVLLQRS
jgi:ketosteroid isomerase-like protein